MFDGEHGIALHAMLGIGPHLVARGKSHAFSSCSGNLGYILELNRDGHSKLVFAQRHQDSCLVMKDTSGISTRLGKEKWTLLEVSRETEHSLLVDTVILGFLSIFTKIQASSPFEAWNSTYLSRCQTDVRPPFQMSWGPRVFPRASTGDSDVPSFVR